MYKFSVPSKTFLIGEYSVMQGGNGLLVATHPRFEAIVKEISGDEEASYEGFSAQGPAISYLKDHIKNFSKYSVSINDPHQGKGGLGWSSAQFVILYAVNQWIERGSTDFQLSRQKILEDFLTYAWNGEGWAPSGLDVLCHLEGGLMQVTAPRKILSGKIESVVVENFHRFDRWPFKDLDFCLVRTGTKVATHAHLSNLHDINFSSLAKISEQASLSLKNNDEESFLNCVNSFRKDLEDQSLIEPNTLHIFHQLQDRPEVLAYKGCGALGADVLLVIVISDLKSDFEEWAKEKGFEWLASSVDISNGLKIEKLNQEEFF